MQSLAEHEESRQDLTDLRVVHVLPNLAVGGAEVFTVQLVEELLGRGVEAHLICVTAGGPLLERMDPALRPRLHVIGKRARYDATVLPRLVRLLRRLRPDVVHTHLFTAQSWGGVAARLAGVPLLVHTQHGAVDRPTRFVRWVDRTLLRRVDHQICCSPAAADFVRGGGYAGGSVSVIENGIPLQGRARATLDHQPPIVGSVGRLAEVKGHRFLVEAVGLLRDQGRHVRLVLVGDGPARKDVEERIRTLRLEDRVELVGRVDDVPRWMAGFDLFVLPSLSEALPLALLEAGAAGLPVLVTASGGARIPVEEGMGGFIVPPADARALADAIEGYVAMPLEERRDLGERSFRHVAERYSLEASADRYLELYAELLNARNDGADPVRLGSLPSRHQRAREPRA